MFGVQMSTELLDRRRGHIDSEAVAHAFDHVGMAQHCDDIGIHLAYDLPRRTGGDDDAIVGAISSLARTLKLAVVAEGVETAGQRDALLARGVEYMQGYYYSKPLPATDFEALLRNSAVRESWRLPAA